MSCKSPHFHKPGSSASLENVEAPAMNHVLFCKSNRGWNRAGCLLGMLRDSSVSLVHILFLLVLSLHLSVAFGSISVGTPGADNVPENLLGS